MVNVFPEPTAKITINSAFIAEPKTHLIALMTIQNLIMEKQEGAQIFLSAKYTCSSLFEKELNSLFCNKTNF